MLPLSLLKTAQGHPMLVELKNGETYNGHLVNCDTWMNIHLREVICTSKDGDRFWRMPECYIRGNTIKYLRVPDEVIDKVQEETKNRADRKPPGLGRGRGRGREDGPGGRQPKGVGRGLDDGAKGVGGRGRGGLGGKTSGGRKRAQNMGKESELWDDSALIDAFDNAMYKYKKMHGKKNGEANVSVVFDQSGDQPLKRKDAGENSNASLNAGTVTEEVEDLELVKQNHAVDLQMPEPYIDSSTSLPMQEKQDGKKGYVDSQGAQDYNQLLSQYYEVENKRQMILHQLQQFDGWNYQHSAEGSSAAAQWGTSCASLEYPTSIDQPSQSTAFCSCCPYVCQSLMAPCTSYPCCSLVGTCAGKSSTEPNGAVAHGKLPTAIDSDIVKTAMGAAERAISSMTTKGCINPNINEDNKEKKDEEEMNQSTSCETDLTVVLNAWYSAGFYTGKYLMEQSIAKKRQ